MWHSHTEIETIDKLKVQNTHTHVSTNISIPTTKNNKNHLQFCSVFGLNHQLHLSKLTAVLCVNSVRRQKIETKQNTCMSNTKEKNCHVCIWFICGFFQRNHLYRIVLIKALGNSQSTVFEIFVFGVIILLCDWKSISTEKKTKKKKKKRKAK